MAVNSPVRGENRFTGGLRRALPLVGSSCSVAIVGMLSSQLIQSFEARNIPVNRGYFMAFGFGTSAAITALFIFLLVQPSGNLAWFGMPYAIGILVLGAWAAIQVLRSMRNRNIPA